MTYIFKNLTAGATFADFAAEYKSMFGDDYFDTIPEGLIATANDEFVTVRNGHVEMWIDDGNHSTETV